MGLQKNKVVYLPVKHDPQKIKTPEPHFVCGGLKIPYLVLLSEKTSNKVDQPKS